MFELADGQIINVGNEVFRAPEVLFQPAVWGTEQFGIHEIVQQAISKCSINIQGELYQNIVLAGGNTMFPGFSERLQKELTQSVEGRFGRIEVKGGGAQRQYSAWVGGSIAASLESFGSFWMTKEEFDEYGPSLIHRKCYEQCVC